MYLEPDASEVTALIEWARTVDTVDTHQHLAPEAPMETDVCQLIAADCYLQMDLTTAGLEEASRAFIMDPSAPLLARWQRLRPFWPQVRFGSYARSILITLHDLYGAEGLKTDEEVEAVSARLTADMATPGLFHRVFWEHCHISDVLTQPVFISYGQPRFHTIARPLDRMDFRPGRSFEQDAGEVGVRVTSADDLVPAMDAVLRRAAARGAIGFKMAAFAWKQPSEAEVRADFARRDHSGLYGNEWGGSLHSLYISRMAAMAAELGLVVAVHSSAPWTNWLDFRVWEPTQLIPLLQTFRDTKFDLYHAGLPYGTNASMLAKVFPNLWQNLNWSHALSPELSMRSLAEWLDMVPLNKVNAFGGDYGNDRVVVTYGQLEMARENVARVLGYRVRHGRMTHEEACEVVEAWFSGNPRELYRLAP